MNCDYTVINKEDIGIIKHLWEKLSEMHLNDSRYFKEHYKTFTFEKRCEKFNGIAEGNIRIEIIEVDNYTAGYCISTIEKEIGEIDSLFIEEQYRKYGFGSKLVQNSINWLKSNNCKKIMVAVAEGHESVLKFYEKHDFFPRMTYLQIKE